MSRIPVVAKFFVLTMGVLLVSNVCYAQRGGRGGGMFGINRATLVGAEQVQGELKLSDSQKTQVTTFVEDNRASRQERFAGLRDLSPEERTQKLAAAAKEDDAKINAILKPEQQKRLNEIYLQVRGASALADEAVAKALGLTSEQKTKIGDILSAERETLAGLREGLQDLSQDERQAKFAEIAKKTEDINKATEKTASAVLTDAQKTQLAELKGAAFALDRSQLGGFGGRRRNNN